MVRQAAASASVKKSNFTLGMFLGSPREGSSDDPGNPPALSLGGNLLYNASGAGCRPARGYQPRRLGFRLRPSLKPVILIFNAVLSCQNRPGNLYRRPTRQRKENC